MTVKLLIADSQTLFVEGMRSMVKRHNPYWQVMVAANSGQLIPKLTESPDLVVLDYAQPGYFTVDDLRQVKQKLPDVSMLMLSSDNDAAGIQQVLNLGVDGFLTKTCGENAIMSAIYKVLNGGCYYCNEIKDMATAQEHSLHTNPEWQELTAREKEIVKLLAEGNTNNIVAERLFISPYTVRTHRKNAMKKLGIRSISELVLYAVNTGLIA